MKKYYLIRHGHTNTIERNQVAETELDELGINQIQRVATYIKDLQVESIYASPYRRALHSAKIIAQQNPLDIQVDERLKEIALWINPEDLHDDTSDEYLNALALFMETEKKIEEFLGEINQKDHQTVVIVCHGNFIRAFLGHILKMNLETIVRLNVHHASISAIDHDDSGIESFYRLEHFNLVDFPIN